MEQQTHQGWWRFISYRSCNTAIDLIYVDGSRQDPIQLRRQHEQSGSTGRRWRVYWFIWWILGGRWSWSKRAGPSLLPVTTGWNDGSFSSAPCRSLQVLRWFKMFKCGGGVKTSACASWKWLMVDFEVWFRHVHSVLLHHPAAALFSAGLAGF